jgi:putative DNA primase/helicase
LRGPDDTDLAVGGKLPSDPSEGTEFSGSLIELFGWTDSGNAERLVALRGPRLKFVRGWGKWVEWDGRRWSVDEGAPFRAAKATARAMQADAAKIDDYERRQAATRFALKSESKAGITAMVSLARHEAAIAITHAQLDADPWALNVANGTIDLQTGKLRPHRREDLITKLAPVIFDKFATCPIWLAFLERAMAGDKDVVGYVQRLFGYALTASVREHLLAFNYGPGANGKSTCLRIGHELLGDYASPAPRGLLFRSRGERHPTELATLFGRRYVTCSEIEEGQAFDEALVKDLTGDDLIECRRMREDFWAFAPSHKLWLAGNHKPTVRGDDEGIWRRLRLIPWLVTIPANERDKNLPEKLRAELPGILRWAVEGCLEWQAKGLDEPEAVRRATREYREQNDGLGEFFRLYVVFEPDAKVARKEIRERYEEFCKDNGAQPLGAKRFAGRLRERGITEGNVRQGQKFLDGWRGVRLATETEREIAARWIPRGDDGTSGGQNSVSLPRDEKVKQAETHTPQSPHAPTGYPASWDDEEVGE